MRHVRRRSSGHEVVTDVGSPTPGPDLPGRRRVPGSEPACAPGGQPPAGARASPCDASASRRLGSRGPRAAVATRAAARVGLSPLPLVGPRPRAPRPPPLGSPVALLRMLRPVRQCQGPSRPPAQVQFGGVGPTVSFTQFYSVPLLPGLPASGLGRVGRCWRDLL